MKKGETSLFQKKLGLRVSEWVKRGKTEKGKENREE
jgi:hypothetical protein